jgi:hypothetical protein
MRSVSENENSNFSKLSFFFHESGWITDLDEEYKFLCITGDGYAKRFFLIYLTMKIFVVDVHLHQRDDWNAQGSSYKAFQVSL